MSDVSVIVGSAVSLVAVCGLLIKFVIYAVFVSLQKQNDSQQSQITALGNAAAERDKEIIQLRGLIDDWQDRYYKLQNEHTALQMKHEQLQRDFDRMREKK